jgi:hypothetical protein
VLVGFEVPPGRRCGAERQHVERQAVAAGLAQVLVSCGQRLIVSAGGNQQPDRLRCHRHVIACCGVSGKSEAADFVGILKGIMGFSQLDQNLWVVREGVLSRLERGQSIAPEAAVDLGEHQICLRGGDGTGRQGLGEFDRDGGLPQIQQETHQLLQILRCEPHPLGQKGLGSGRFRAMMHGKSREVERGAPVLRIVLQARQERPGHDDLVASRPDGLADPADGAPIRPAQRRTQEARSTNRRRAQGLYSRIRS